MYCFSLGTMFKNNATFKVVAIFKEGKFLIPYGG